MCPPKQAPQVGVETIAPASTNTSSRPSRERLAVDRTESPGRRSARQSAWTCGRAGSRPSGAGRSSSRSSSCRCTPGRSSFRLLPRPERRCPGRCGSATRGSNADRSISSVCASTASVSERSGRPWPRLDPAVRGTRRSSRRRGTGRSPRPPRPPCSRRRGARRPRARPRRRRRTRATAFVAPPTPISPITARIRSLPVTNGRFSPVKSTRIVAGHRLPELPEREAGADVGRPEAGRRRRPAPRTCRCASRRRRPPTPARSSPPRRGACARSRHGPGRRTSTPCPLDHSFSRRWSSAERASFAGMKWSATITTFAGSKTLLDAPSAPSPGRRRAARRRSP